MAIETDKTAVHLVLGGGGVLCLAYAGALRILAERGLDFASVSTCSAGTFIGALLCAGLSAEEIEREIDQMSPLALLGEPAMPWLLSPVVLLRWPFAKYRKPGFPTVFNQIVGGRNPTFAELEIPFGTAAIDIVSNRLLVYASETHPNMRVSEALAIAVAIPLAYPPYERDGRILLDAGIASDCPVWLATGRDDDLPIVAMRPSHPKVTAPRKSVVQYLTESRSSAVRSRDDYVIEEMPRVRMIEIDSGDIRPNQFDLTTAQKKSLVTAGQEAAEKALKQFGDDLSNASPIRLPILTGDTPDDVAVAGASQLLARHHQKLSGLVRNQIFISYSHEDKDFLDRLQVALKPVLRNTSTVAWDDRRIRPGRDWATEIDQALDTSKVVLMLVTPNYLASDYIMEKELPSILDRRRKGLKIHWLPCSASAWEETPLKGVQASSDPDRPLDQLTAAEFNEALVVIGKKLKVDLYAAC